MQFHFKEKPKTWLLAQKTLHSQLCMSSSNFQKMSTWENWTQLS